MQRESYAVRKIGIVLIQIAMCSLLIGSTPTTLQGQSNLLEQTKWRISDPVVYESLSVFPILSRGDVDTTGFVTLDEALTGGEVVVTETGGNMLRRTRRDDPAVFVQPVIEGAQVNQLVLIHRGKKPLLLLAGEVVTGGKQDRVIAKDRIVPPGADPLPLDVFCVERGRWAGAATHFSAAQMMVHPSVREKAVIDQDQSRVWAAVRSGTTRTIPPAVAETTGVSRRILDRVIAAETPSESYVKIFKSARLSGQVERFAEEFAHRFARATAELKEERVVGVVVAYGGEVAWADAFASSEMFSQYWKKLLRSYVVEALARPERNERPLLEDAREFVQPLTGRETVEKEPGVYRWRKVEQGRYTEIYLDTLGSDTLTLHWCKVLRSN